jgi:hypothetical protein
LFLLFDVVGGGSGRGGVPSDLFYPHFLVAGGVVIDRLSVFFRTRTGGKTYSHKYNDAQQQSTQE